MLTGNEKGFHDTARAVDPAWDDFHTVDWDVF